MAKFNEKNFQFDDESKKFMGADEWLKDLQEKDAGAFDSSEHLPNIVGNTTGVKGKSYSAQEIDKMDFNDYKNWRNNN